MIPLLSESKDSAYINRVCVVDAAPEVQLERTMTRDHLDRETALRIIQSQHERETRLSKADDTIYNDGSIKELKQQVLELHQLYLGLAS